MIYATGMKVRCNRKDVLRAIKENRERHSEIVKEARVGYVQKAKEALKRSLGKLERGKIIQLAFSLRVPEDHTKDYDTVIRMLELHQDDSIELSGDEVRQFIEDQWDWRGAFLRNNAAYSATSAAMLEDDG